MERLGRKAVDPKVEVAVLAGNQPDLLGMLNEYTGPSDGLLFVESVLQMPADAKVVGEEVMPLNHLALVKDAESFRWISDQLDKTNPTVMSPEEREAVRVRGLQPPVKRHVPTLIDDLS